MYFFKHYENQHLQNKWEREKPILQAGIKALGISCKNSLP